MSRWKISITCSHPPLDAHNRSADYATFDRRRTERLKPSSKEWRDALDRSYPEDTTLCDAPADYHYVRIDNSGVTLAETVERIKHALPEVFGNGGALGRGAEATG